MKKTVLSLSLIAFFSGSSAWGANEIINYTPVTPGVGANGERVIAMPDKKTVTRRRMLFDFGLFGAGIHVGWLKPRNMDVRTADGGEIVTVRKRHGIGSPIFNVSAGTHALGLGTK
jgi:hypothetical protein